MISTNSSIDGDVGDEENVVDVSTVGILSLVVVSDNDVLISVVTISNVVDDDAENVKGSSVDDVAGSLETPSSIEENVSV